MDRAGSRTRLSLVSCLRGSQAKSLDAGEDLFGRLDPDERLGVFIVGGEVEPDCVLESAGAAMSAAPKLLLSQGGEPPLDLIDPGGIGRREVEVEAGMPQKPSMDQRRLVGAVVVEDQVHVEDVRDFLVNAIEEVAELGRAVSLFFQAEDGIRDLIVTGVQTCALPI